MRPDRAQKVTEAVAVAVAEDAAQAAAEDAVQAAAEEKDAAGTAAAEDVFKS